MFWPPWTGRDADGPRIREFQGIVEQVDENLAQPARIALEKAGRAGHDIDDQFHTFLLGLKPYGRGSRMHHGGQVEMDRNEPDAASLDTGKIKYVVDDVEQVQCSLAGSPNVVTLFRGKRRVQRDLRHAENGVHGRADFMTDRGKKFTFGLTRLFRHGTSVFKLDILLLDNPLVHERLEAADVGSLRDDQRHGGQNGHVENLMPDRDRLRNKQMQPPGNGDNACHEQGGGLPKTHGKKHRRAKQKNIYGCQTHLERECVAGDHGSIHQREENEDLPQPVMHGADVFIVPQRTEQPQEHAADG